MGSIEREEVILNGEISFIYLTYFFQSLLEQLIPILKWGVPSPHYRDRTNTPKSLRPSLLDSSIFGLSRMPKFMALRLLDPEIFNFQKCLLEVVYLYIYLYISISLYDTDPP